MRENFGVPPIWCTAGPPECWCTNQLPVDRRAVLRRILLIEDNADLAHLLPVHLGDLDCSVEVVRDGRTGLDRAMVGQHEIIVLDLLLPGVSGIEICQRLRRARNHTPILMLTSKSSEFDRVLGLDVGADDYLAKPFSIRELLARIRSILRRQEVYAPSHSGQLETLGSGGLSIDLATRQVKVNGMAGEVTAQGIEPAGRFWR